MVFRSILVPLKAALGFLLSVVAALGAVVAVFQWGWLAGLLGVEETGPIMSMMPIFMMGVVFGLAMDYEVFLVTRMREAYVHGETPRPGDRDRLPAQRPRRHRGRGHHDQPSSPGFIGSSESMIKMIGFGLAIARPLRRVRRPDGDRPGGAGAARQAGLVAAAAGWTGCCPTWTSRARACARRRRRGRDPATGAGTRTGSWYGSEARPAVRPVGRLMC